MRTTAGLIAQACIDAKVPGYTAQALAKLNDISEELCLTHDFGLARGVYYFSLNPTLITTIGGITNFGGPYPLPLDYLRTSGSSGTDGVQYSFFYVYNGVPYPLMPMDLGRLDMQVQQPGIQNLPYAFATDVSTESTFNDRIAGTLTAAVTIASQTIRVTSSNTGIVPIVARMVVGMSVAGIGIAPGSTVLSITPDAPAPNTTYWDIVLSLPAIGTDTAASFMFGTPVNAYVYPGPSGAFPTTLRYQRMMPPITDTGRVPWFPDQTYLLERLTGELMATTDDERRGQTLAIAAQKLAAYEKMSDDKTNRAQTVLLDRQVFGPRFDRLKNTKTIGW